MAATAVFPCLGAGIVSSTFAAFGSLASMGRKNRNRYFPYRLLSVYMVAVGKQYLFFSDMSASLCSFSLLYAAYVRVSA